MRLLSFAALVLAGANPCVFCPPSALGDATRPARFFSPPGAPRAPAAAAERFRPVPGRHAGVSLGLPRPGPGAARFVAAGVAASWSAQPLRAEEAAAAASTLPDDRIVVVFALVILVLAGLQQASLGDIVADEAQLPSSVNLINKNRQRRSSFIKGKK